MSSEDAVAAEVLKICDRTRRAIARHRFATEEELDAFVERAHRDALAGIADPAIRFRVALVLGYEGKAGDT
jgi:hypothetical protein